MDKHTANEMITAATDLDELLEALQDITEALDGSIARLDELVDLGSLPTYGGEVPGDTEGIYSWDSGRVLWGDAGWYIADREADADEEEE